MKRFRVTQDFVSEEFRSQYVAGLSYTARTDQLAAAVQQWVLDGKAEWITTDPTQGSVAGTGVVR